MMITLSFGKGSVMKKLDLSSVKIFDGAMGTRLLNMGIPFRPRMEELNLTQPEVIRTIHRSYVEAGADFILTDTFGVNAHNFKNSDYSLSEIILAAIENVKVSINEEQSIILDIGPIGRMMEPYGDMTEEEATAIFREIIMIAKDNVDAILFETFMDLDELTCGIQAAKEISDLPIFATMTFNANGHTLMGIDVETMIERLESLHVSALGANCSLGPIELQPVVEDLLRFSHTPILIQPNAGLPHVHSDGSLHYHIDTETFVQAIAPWVDHGVKLIGGCCGTDATTIRALAQHFKGKN